MQQTLPEKRGMGFRLRYLVIPHSLTGLIKELEPPPLCWLRCLFLAFYCFWPKKDGWWSSVAVDLTAFSLSLSGFELNQLTMFAALGDTAALLNRVLIWSKAKDVRGCYRAGPAYSLLELNHQGPVGIVVWPRAQLMGKKRKKKFGKWCPLLVGLCHKVKIPILGLLV